MLIQDVSRYQQAINFNLMKSTDQEYIIIKVGGSLRVDAKFVEHCAGATLSGIHVAGYYWDDPIEDGELQGRHYLSAIQGKPIVFLEIDFEHWWADWKKWTQWRVGDIPISGVPVISSDKLLANLKAMYNYVVANTDLKVVIYTAAWFLNAYCPEAYEFLKSVYTHWADYSYFNDTPVFRTWEQLATLAPVGKPIPSLPKDYPLDKVVMIQWSGDKFTAEGVWGDTQKTRFSALDLNLWVNTKMTIDNFSKLQGGNVMPPIVVPTFIQSTKFLRNLNIPYVSQLGVDASNYNNDCGAASAAMIVHGYTDQKPTVDEVHMATGQTADVYLTAYQLINVLAHYGVPANWKISNLATLLVDIHSGRPAICLILYGVLVDAGVTENKSFRGFHFVTVVGYDAENIYINDPLWNGIGGKEVAVPQGIFDRAWQQAGANPSLNPAYGCIVPTAILGQPATVSSANYKVIASKLNIRSTPNSNIGTNIVGALYYGNVVQIESIDTEGWGKIVGKTQYVYMIWLLKV